MNLLKINQGIYGWLTLFLMSSCALYPNTTCTSYPSNQQKLDSEVKQLLAQAKETLEIGKTTFTIFATSTHNLNTQPTSTPFSGSGCATPVILGVMLRPALSEGFTITRAWALNEEDMWFATIKERVLFEAIMGFPIDENSIVLFEIKDTANGKYFYIKSAEIIYSPIS